MTEGSDERAAVAALSQLAPLFSDAQGSLRDLHLLLLTAPKRLTRPVRLAVVGQIKKGKSTLVNALLGERLAATGPLETTFRINEFRYGEREVVRAHYHDDRLGRDRVEEIAISDLYGLTVRDPAREAELRDLRRIVVDLPQPLLLSFDLIDTPGLSSIYVTDSESTLALLGREITNASVAELDKAEAVLYLFNRDLGAADTEVVSQFLGHPEGRALGAGRALGVVSKCDMIWPPPPGVLEQYNPIESYGKPKIDAYLAQEPEIGQLFYDIVPVAALVAEGARNAEPECFNWLADLAKLDPAPFMSLLRYPSRFTTVAERGCRVPAAQRAELYRHLGPWGILLAYRYLREDCSEEQIREQLFKDSGVQRIQDLVVSHFGKRAYLVKLDRILSGIRETIAVHDQEVSGGAAGDANVELVKNAVEDITDREQDLWTMQVLRLIGQGQLKLSPKELSRMSRLVEPGASCASRLGMPKDTPAAELVPIANAEVGYWRTLNNDVLSFDAEARDITRLLLRAAEDIKSRVVKAEDFLKQSEQLRERSQSLLRWA